LHCSARIGIDRKLQGFPVFFVSCPSEQFRPFPVITVVKSVVKISTGYAAR